MLDLWHELERRLSWLDSALKEVGVRGREYAEAEAAYRTELAAQILELRADNMPVTICPDVARGTESVAKLKLDRDCKEALYLASKESINTLKLQIKILEAQYDREYRG